MQHYLILLDKNEISSIYRKQFTKKNYENKMFNKLCFNAANCLGESFVDRSLSPVHLRCCNIGLDFPMQSPIKYHHHETSLHGSISKIMFMAKNYMSKSFNISFIQRRCLLPPIHRRHFIATSLSPTLHGLQFILVSVTRASLDDAQ